MESATWLKLLEQYGPVVGLLLAMIGWQWRAINRLLRENKEAYLGEIERMAKRETRLLNHILGHDPASSGEFPTFKELNKVVQEADNSSKQDGEES